MLYDEIINDINKYYQNRKYKKALELYLNINTNDLTSHDYCMIGLCYNQLYKYDMAYKYFVLAKNNNDSYAFYMLGLYYEKGKIVKQSYSEAFKYFLQSAKLGVAKGMREVGFYYALKPNFGYNYNKALYWLLLAIKTDNELEETILSWLYYNASVNKNIIAEILNYRLDSNENISKIFGILINDNNEEFNLIDYNQDKVRFQNRFFTILDFGDGYKGYSILFNLDSNNLEVFSFELTPKDDNLLLTIIDNDDIKNKVLLEYYKNII